MPSDKKEYIPYTQIASQLNINTGDIVMVSSDIKRLILSTLENGETFDIDCFIDSLVEKVGTEGTLLFPTYNWDFCKGKPFDYKKTKPYKVGSLGKAALKRNDFRRTAHALYSFAVFGKDQDYLCAMNNTDSFGTDSPFKYLHKDAKALQIDVPLSQCFTFAHYVEQQVGVPYRFIKTFTAPYIDAVGHREIRSYSMYVRYLDANVKTILAPIEDDLARSGKIQYQVINEITYSTLMFSDFYKVAEDDIIHNGAEKLASYDKGGKFIAE